MYFAGLHSDIYIIVCIFFHFNYLIYLKLTFSSTCVNELPSFKQASKLLSATIKSVIYVSKYGNSFEIKLIIYTLQYSQLSQKKTRSGKDNKLYRRLELLKRSAIMFLKNILFCVSSNQMDFVFSLSPARPYLSYDTSANQ